MMVRQVEKPAPGWLVLKTRRGWVLIAERLSAAGDLVGLSLALADDDSTTMLWRGRDGRRWAVRESWKRQQEGLIEQQRQEIERLRAMIQPGHAGYAVAQS